MNIRDIIKGILNNIPADIHAVEATSKMVELSSLLGNLGEHIVKFEKAYIMVKVKTMTDNEKMPMTKIELLSQATDEYSTLQEAKALREAVIEVIRTLKYRCRALEDEYSVSNNT